jgi:pyruvate ferredoxin oxidoreductase gamma subunit
MLQIRIHGRGGQGVVTAAELLSAAAFREGKYAQAFPSFGSERTGAPVMSFCRIDDKPIRVREPVMHPDVLVVQDPTLLHQVDVFEGAGDDALLVINSARPATDLGIADFTSRLRPGAVLTVAATELAQQHVGRPVPNAALLGGFAALTGLVSIESVEAAIGDRFSGVVGAGNVAAARTAYVTASGQLAGTPAKDGAPPLVQDARLAGAAKPAFGTARVGQIEGSRGVAEAVALCRPEVVCAYPISPQTHIVEALATLVKAGDLTPIDLDYCKGCGICATECPCGAIDMIPERI